MGTANFTDIFRKLMLMYVDNYYELYRLVEDSNFKKLLSNVEDGQCLSIEALYQHLVRTIQITYKTREKEVTYYRRKRRKLYFNLS